ncbi:hypothetical protein BG004_002683 [Podila humilis]|nr:hypothetical protein BG004_002683 [Podila humilis]
MARHRLHSSTPAPLDFQSDETTFWRSTLLGRHRRGKSPDSDGDLPSFDAAYKEPSTAPGALPSDQFAQYIYHEVFPLHPDSRVPHLRPPSRRTIVVGDIHGSLDGFNGFLAQIEFDPRRDGIILAGDMVAKGPRSREVIDKAIELGAKCVRGNHDDKVIRWRGYLDSLSAAEKMELESYTEDVEGQEDGDVDGDDGDDDADADEYDEIDEDDIDYNDDIDGYPRTYYDDDGNGLANDLRKRKKHHKKKAQKKHKKKKTLHAPADLNRDSEHYQIAQSLSDKQYEYLKSCPLILTVPRQLSVHNIPIHVVHAGIDPRQNILHQKPWVLFNVRNLLDDGTPSRKKGQGQGWAKAFNDLHLDRHSRSRHDFLVVYGHDAGRSLNIRTWTIGLDSGCVYGRALSGYVIETGHIHSVPCPENGGK